MMFPKLFTSYKLQKINIFIGLSAFAFHTKALNNLQSQLNNTQTNLELLKNFVERNK